MLIIEKIVRYLRLINHLLYSFKEGITVSSLFSEILLSYPNKRFFRKSFNIKLEKKFLIKSIQSYFIAEVDKDEILKSDHFSEKLKGDGAWINGGYFVLNNKIFDYLKDDQTIWEREPLEKISKNKELVAYRASLLEQQNKEPTNYKLKLIKAINDLDANELEWFFTNRYRFSQDTIN